jgi:hypothetical protein
MLDTATARSSLAGKLTGPRSPLPDAAMQTVPASRASSMAAWSSTSGMFPPKLRLTKSHLSATAWSIALAMA